MKRHKSVPVIHDPETVSYSSMQPPHRPQSIESSSASIPSSLPQRHEMIQALFDTQRALEQRPDVTEPDDYVMIGKLIGKLTYLDD